MANSHLALQRAERVLVEDLRHQALVTDRQDIAAPRRGGDARRLLSPVLKCEQREVREAGDVMTGTVDPEDAAFVAWPVAMVGVRGHPAAGRLARPRF